MCRYAAPRASALAAGPAFGAVLAAALGCAGPAAAQAPGDPGPPPPDPAGALSLAIENDTLGGTDRYYTNGLQIAWRSPSADLPSALAWLDRQLAFLQGPGTLRWGIAIGQSIYTPEDTQRRNPDPTDRPYAGYLYGALSLNRVTAESLSVLELQAGLVGPSAGGKFVQNGFHSVIGVDPARGWDYQLADEPVFGIVLDRKWRVALGGDERLGAELLPSATVSLGTAQTYAGAGALLRVGRNLAADFGPPRIRPALAGSSFFQPRGDDFGWYVFGGVEGRAVARDIFLDGNTWADSRSVDARPSSRICRPASPSCGGACASPIPRSGAPRSSTASAAASSNSARSVRASASDTSGRILRPLVSLFHAFRPGANLRFAWLAGPPAGRIRGLRTSQRLVPLV